LQSGDPGELGGHINTIIAEADKLGVEGEVGEGLIFFRYQQFPALSALSRQWEMRRYGALELSVVLASSQIFTNIPVRKADVAKDASLVGTCRSSSAGGLALLLTGTWPCANASQCNAPLAPYLRTAVDQ
jgi:hypothetical protein